ncbi:excalibur calcium-binding domain-containing protein [Nocardioides aquiterrae]|uniref:Excalibur calcium-binding domain-containing protein n=1 Tax=Nocardioides aquiterrae TaxID=203799 RepID=A0ABN1UIB6_9ACTN
MTARWLTLLLSLVTGLAVAILAIPESSVAVARGGGADCGDFSTQAAAQQWFINHGGPLHDPAGLDADHDGIACESNPCPCSSAQGGGGGGTPGNHGGGSVVGLVHDVGRGLWCYRDKPADARPAINVTKTCLDVRKKRYYRVHVYGGDFAKNRTDIVRIYFDTLRRRGAPEFDVSWYLGRNPATETGSLFFEKTKSWRKSSAAECKHIGRSVDYKRDVITVAVPRKCLGNPLAVRWAGFTGQISRATDSTMYGKWDDFPRVNGFPKRWVA